jgi:hypothetical protein
MQYLVEAENIDGLVQMKEVPDYVTSLVLPSYEMLIKLEEEGKIKGGLIAGQRAGVFVIDADSNEDLGKKLRSFPFWGMVKWKTTALQSFKSALEQDGGIIKAFGGD